jgi:hypothetical protein
MWKNKAAYAHRGVKWQWACVHRAFKHISQHKENYRRTGWDKNANVKKLQGAFREPDINPEPRPRLLWAVALSRLSFSAENKQLQQAAINLDAE